jgi:ankyrin repeat protein
MLQKIVKFCLIPGIVILLSALTLENKVNADPMEYICVKNALVAELQNKMGLKNKNAFSKVLTHLGIFINGKKFSCTTSTIILDPTQKTIQVKGEAAVFYYNPTTGELTEVPPASYEEFTIDQLEEYLHTAICNDQALKVQRILAAGKIDINEPLHDRFTPLQLAAHQGSTSVVRELFNMPGINVDSKGVVGATALFLAAENRHSDVVKTLVVRANVDIPCDTHGGTPLFMATQNNDCETARILVAAGADPNIPIKGGFTPLHFVAENGRLDMAELILSIDRVVVNQCTDDEQGAFTPLHMSIVHDKCGVARILIADPRTDLHVLSFGGFSPFFAAVQKRDFKSMKAMVEKDCTVVDIPNESGYTSLGFAAENGDLESVSWLIDHGAGVNRFNNNGETPVFCATAKNYCKVVDKLLKSGAQPDISRKDGTTPLIYAISKKYNKIARFLIEFYSNVNGIKEISIEEEQRTNDLTQTPFRVAIQVKNQKMVEFLLSRPDFHLTYMVRGNSVELLQAIGYGTYGIVLALLNWGEVHVNEYALVCAKHVGAEKRIIDFLAEKLRSLEEAEEPSPEEEWIEDAFEEEDIEEVPEEREQPQPNPLLDQAAMLLVPALPATREALVDVNYLLETFTPLEPQVAEWLALNRLFHRTTPFPLQVNVHTRNAVRPRMYVQAVLDRLCVLLENGYNYVKVIFITGRGLHARQQRGVLRLKEAVFQILRQKGISVLEDPSNPGRLELDFREGKFV